MTSLDKYFETLDLKPGASVDEIRQAYRDLAQIWHPDRYAHNPRLRIKAEERFKCINEAYQKLVFELQNHPQNTPPKSRTSESKISPEPPRPPSQGMQPQTSSNRGCGWTLLSIISIVLIRSCFTAIQEPRHTNDSDQTYQQPLPTAAAPPTSKSDKSKTIPPAVAAASSLAPEISAQMPIPIKTPPTIQTIPESELKDVAISFFTPGPEARGKLTNHTEWTISGATVIIRRRYKQIVTGVVIVDPPEPDSYRFKVVFPEGKISPLTTGEIAVNIGRYLDAYENDLGNGLHVTFRVAESFVTIDSMQGYQ